MAFDKVFSGDPRLQDVAAPGSHQNPSFGIDIVNNELYTSSGDGWEPVSSSSSGGIVIPSIIYDSTFNPLPPPSLALLGATAIVSDALLPTFLELYEGGGFIVSRVICNGTEWVTA